MNATYRWKELFKQKKMRYYLSKKRCWNNYFWRCHQRLCRKKAYKINL